MKGIGRTFPRGNIWYYAYGYRGTEIKVSSHSTSQAVARQMLRDAIRRLGRDDHYDPRRERLTVGEMVATVVLDRQVRGRRCHNEAQLMKHLGPFFGGLRAIQIGDDAIRRYIAMRQEERAAPNTINNELRLLRRAFRLNKAPAPEIKLLPDNSARRDFLDIADFERVREQLGEFSDFWGFAGFSAWRQGQIAALEWRDVDLEHGIVVARGETTKNGQPHIIPLVGELRAIIERAKALRRLDCPYVFHRDGKPIGLRGSMAPARRAWVQAIAAAGFAGHVPHCLRRSAIRNMSRAGVPDHVTMEISGHRTRHVFDRYNIVSPKDKQIGLERMFAYLNENHGESRVRAIR